MVLLHQQAGDLRVGGNGESLNAEVEDAQFLAGARGVLLRQDIRIDAGVHH